MVYCYCKLFSNLKEWIISTECHCREEEYFSSWHSEFHCLLPILQLSKTLEMMEKRKAALTVQQGFLTGVFPEPSSAPSMQYQKQLRSLLHSQYPLARRAVRSIYILIPCI